MGWAEKIIGVDGEEFYAEQQRLVSTGISCISTFDDWGYETFTFALMPCHDTRGTVKGEHGHSQQCRS